MTFWRERAEHERAPERAESLRSRRRFHASISFLGMVRVDGELDPEAGESLLTALGAVQGAEARSRGRDDRRTPAQRRADAIGEICRQWLDRRDRPMVAGERPHLTVTVPVEALTPQAFPAALDATEGSDPTVSDQARAALRPAAEMDHVGPVTRETARRIACDAAVTRVVLSPGSEPLDIGRRTSVVPSGMRRAVIVRDRHCRFPGCDRPAPWCEIHHIDHWGDGGRTAISNLILQCRRHHRLVHGENGFGLELRDGRPVFRRPDGSPLEAGSDVAQDRAPP